jgi:hypothetical protein
VAFSETAPGGLAQLGERLHGMQEVMGSSPLSSTLVNKKPFGEYVEGLSYCGAKSYAIEPAVERLIRDAQSETSKVHDEDHVYPDIVNKKGPLTIAVSDPRNVGATGFEPATSTSRT